MPDYKNGKIYKISANGLDYYGSTTQSLAKRFYEHRRGYCSAKKLLAYEDCKIELVENCPCDDKVSLLLRERHYITNFPCINKLIPYFTDEEKKEKMKQIDAIRNKTEKRKEMFRKRELKPDRILYRKKYYQTKKIEKLMLDELQNYNV